MSLRFSHTSGVTKMVILIEFFLVSYLIYSLTKNVYNSYQVDNYIASFEAENSKIENENKQKTDDYLYFTSPEYIDKIAKQNLGLVNKGEEVIVLAPEVLDEVNGAENSDGEHGLAKYAGLSNPMKWWTFFFG